MLTRRSNKQLPNFKAMFTILNLAKISSIYSKTLSHWIILYAYKFLIEMIIEIHF